MTFTVWTDDLEALHAFIIQKVQTGAIPESSEERVLLVFADLLDMASEGNNHNLDDPSLQAVCRHGIFLMQQKLLELHPE